MHHHIVGLGSQAASCDHKILRKVRKTSPASTAEAIQSRKPRKAPHFYAVGTRAVLDWRSVTYRLRTITGCSTARTKYLQTITLTIGRYGRYSAGSVLVLLAYTRIVRTERARMTAASAFLSEVDAAIDVLKAEIAATGVGTGSPS